MTRRILSVLMICLVANAMVGQYKKTASCRDSEFDRKVDSYLKYSAPVISVQEAMKAQDSILFIDARGFGEYKVSHIPAARFVDYEKFNTDMVKDIPRDKKIVVYCSIGYRSEKIATRMIHAGFRNVSNLYGSIFEWANAGYELRDLGGKPTKNVHTYNRKWSRWMTNPDCKALW